MKSVFYLMSFLLFGYTLNAQEKELPKNKSAEYYYKFAGEQNKKENYALALEACSMSIAINAAKPWSYNLRGELYLKLEKYDSAFLDYSRFINSVTTNSEAYYNRGKAYLLYGSYEAAVKDFQKAAEIDTGYTGAFYNMGNAYFLKNDFENAELQYNFVVDREYRNPAYRVSRGWLQYKTASYANAVTNFYDAKEIDPNNVKPYYYLMLTHIANKNYHDAYSVYLELTQKNLLLPANDSSMIFMGSYVDAVVNHIYREKNTEALALLKKAKAEYNQYNKNNKGMKSGYYPAIYADLLGTIGLMYERSDSFALATEYYTKAQLLNPFQKNSNFKTSLARIEEKIKIEKNKDVTPPEITLITPVATRGQGVFADADLSGNIFISGKAKDPSGIAWVKINGAPVQNINEDGSFSASVKVKDKFTIQAADRNGNTEAATTFTITKMSYKQPDGSDIPPIPADAAPKFHAILIAESDYDGKTWNKLPSTTKELTELTTVLVEKYNFDAANIDTLFNKGKADIMDKLSSKIENLTEADNLIICFSGHGTFEKKGTELFGYWVPVLTTESSNKQSQYISNVDIQSLIAGCRANHILMLSDACYSGAFKSENSLQTKGEVISVPYNMEYTMKSRNIMTSGGLEKVPGESQFMRLIIKALQANDQKFLSMYDLYSAIAPGVKQSTSNQPVIYPFGKDDEGGQFFFIRNKNQ
ncbi:MAG: tetratricopeptide repeat protein [Bacteroidota bacterium]